MVTIIRKLYNKPKYRFTLSCHKCKGQVLQNIGYPEYDDTPLKCLQCGMPYTYADFQLATITADKGATL